ncbi:MAG: hypothetical protein HOD90_07545, partial [Nitrospina sp.]|nr:hypothetical protein [Nitrospina sp.]
MKPDAIFNMSPVKSKILKGTAIYFFLLLSQFTVGMEKISYAEDSQNIEYEKPPKFKASRMMPAHLLKGRGYKVEEEVFNDGFRNTYMIRSNYGFFNAYGDEMLRIRVNEVHAIDKLTHLKNSDEFLEGASKAINVPISLAKGIFNNPVDTVTGVGKGMGKFLGRIGEMATGKRGETEDHATKELIGFSAAKRMLAGRLKVDVYSTNKKLQEELDSVSWATFSGGF